MTPRHVTQIPRTPVLAPAVEEAIADGMSPHYIIGFLTAAIRAGWTEPIAANVLHSHIASQLARMEQTQ